MCFRKLQKKKKNCATDNKTIEAPHLAVVVGIVDSPSVVGVIPGVERGVDTVSTAIGSLHHLASASIVPNMVVLIVPVQRNCMPQMPREEQENEKEKKRLLSEVQNL